MNRSRRVALSLVVGAAVTACNGALTGPGVGGGNAGGAGTTVTNGAGGATTGGATTSSATSTSNATSATSSVSATSSTGGMMAPPFGSIPWETGTNVGYGVARKDSQNPLGNGVFIGYAGYNITLDAAEAWVTALYGASLKGHGVRWVYAVQGPADPSYAQFEIGNSKIAAALQSQVNASTAFILVAGHSSGSFVAHELLGQLANGLDPSGITAGRVVYFDLDGGQSGLNGTIVQRLRKAYFTSAYDAGTGTYSPNHGSMTSAASAYGTYFDTNANQAGCDAGANWCLHMVLITHRPHDPANADGIPDYSDFAGRPVQHDYIESHAAQAGITP